MKKLFYVLFCCSFILVGCNDDANLTQIASGSFFNASMYIFVVDESGNDLLDPEADKHISLDDIQIDFFNHFGDKGVLEVKEIVDRGERIDPPRTIIKHALSLQPFLPGGIPYYENSCDTGTYIINWGNGYGVDTVSWELKRYAEVCTNIDKIYVNRKLAYQAGAPIQENYVTITKSPH